MRQTAKKFDIHYDRPINCQHDLWNCPIVSVGIQFDANSVIDTRNPMGSASFPSRMRCSGDFRVFTA